MGKRVKAAEVFARRVVERELKRPVVINDDNSAPGMYDLRVGSADAPEIAIECVGAVDQTYTETWNVGPARGPLHLSVKGDWTVEIAPTARVNAVKKGLEQLLKELEERGLYNVYVDYRLEWQDADLFGKFDSLKITHALCYTQQGAGKVYLGMPGAGGAVDDQGRAVPAWVGEFLRDPSKQDVLSKLQRSGAPERHVFVIASLMGTPWEVESYLIGDLNHLPSKAPDLPPPVTGVWIVPGMGQKGIRWDGNSWRFFDARGEGIHN
ncbi:MAG TPA: hypothetical protein VGC66_10615 [Pyrinomonadaceae bacterium]|jgi:hypothetical protein